MSRAEGLAARGPSGLADLAARYAPKLPAGLVMARFRCGAIEVASAGAVVDDAVFELGSITKVVTGLRRRGRAR